VPEEFLTEALAEVLDGWLADSKGAKRWQYWESDSGQQAGASPTSRKGRQDVRAVLDAPGLPLLLVKVRVP
jgi:hypothetical protein